MRKRLSLIPLSVLFSSLSLFAADTTWISAGSQVWQSTGNWTGGVIPGTTTGAIFQDGSSSVYNVLVSGTVGVQSQGIQFGAFTGGSGFSIGQGAGATSSLNIQDAGTANGIVNNDDNTQTFNLPITLTPGNGSQTWNAAAGNLVFSGSYNGSVATVNNNNSGAILTITGPFNTTIGTSGRGDITGFGGLTKSGAGILTLGGNNANTYAGPTTLNAGTLLAAKAGAFGTGSALTLNGGMIEINNGLTETLGTINLQGNATIDLSGTSGLTFADSHSIAWAPGATLTISGWTAGDTLKFGTTAGGLTGPQLSQIFIDDPSNPYASLNASGNIVPVPEPSTAALCLLGGFALTFGLVLRRKNS